MIRDSSLIYSKDSFRGESCLFAFVCLSILPLMDSYLPSNDKHGSSSRLLQPAQASPSGLNNTIAQTTNHKRAGQANARKASFPI